MLDIDLMIKDALKSGNKAMVNAYRNLKSKILLAKTAKNAKEYNDSVEIGIINKYVKELNDDANLYQEKGRADLSQAYVDEANILSELLPKAPTNEEVESFVKAFIKETYDSEVIDKTKMGVVIKAVKAKFPSADGKVVSEIVRKFIV